MIIEIQESDFAKIIDALRSATNYFVKRDQMNAELHLADPARYSPITSVVEAAFQRAGMIFGEASVKAKPIYQTNPEDIGNGE